MIIVLQFVHPPPETVASIVPPPDQQGLYPDPVSITLSATAYQGYTVAVTYYSVDNSSTQTYVESFTVSGTGPHAVKYWSVDNIEVTETPKTLTFEIVSNQPPVADAGGPYGVPEGGTVTLSGSALTPMATP